MSQLTKKQLQEAFALLKDLAEQPKACPKCKAPVFGIGVGPCLDCRGAHIAEWECDGRHFRGLMDGDGTPLFWGPADEMDKLSGPYKPRAQKAPLVYPDVPRYNYNPGTESFDPVP